MTTVNKIFNRELIMKRIAVFVRVLKICVTENWHSIGKQLENEIRNRNISIKFIEITFTHEMATDF